MKIKTIAAVVGLSASTLLAQAVNNVGLPRFPSVSPDGSQIVFAWRGDLWRVDSKGGASTRLTGHPQDDNFSIWSPDGKQIAFTSERVGGGNLFVMNADGTGVKQITQTDRYLVPFGWHEQDGILVNGRIEQDWFPALRSYAVSLDGGDPVRLFDAFGATPSISPDGSKVLFTRGTTGWSRRGYKGADNRELWLYDRATKQYKQLTTWAGNDGRAKWVDNETFVFHSDREDGTVNLYMLKLGEEESAARRLTPNKDVDVEEYDISRDGRTLVYASWDRLYRLDLGNLNGVAAGTPIDLFADEDAGALVNYRSIGSSVSEAALSPDGKAIAVVAFGQVYVRGTDNRATARRVNATLSRCSGLSWSPDGSTLYFSSDESGVDAIYAATVTLTRSSVKKAIEGGEKTATTEEASTSETRPARRVRPAGPVGRPTDMTDADAPTIAWADDEPATQTTTEPTTQEAATQEATTQPATAAAKKEEEKFSWGDALRFEVKPLINSGESDLYPESSPDGKSIAFQRGQGQLWIRDVATGTERLLVDGWSRALEWRWSGDSKRIAFVTEDINNNRDIFIVPADGSTAPVNITRHPDNDFSPRWSADGKILAFLSQRNNNETDVYMVYLDRDLEGLSSADLDAYYKDAADKAKKRERPKTKPATQPTTVASTKPAATTQAEAQADDLELDDAYLRVRRLTSIPGSEGNLEITPAGDRYLFTASITGGRSTMVLDRGGGEPRRLAGSVNVQRLTFEGDKAVVIDSGRGSPSEEEGPSGGRAGLLNLASGSIESYPVSDRLPIDLAKFNEQKFREAARVLGAVYYDETMNGLDWKAVTDRYASLVAKTTTSAEFDHVANKLVGELNGSHLGVRSPSPSNSDAVSYGRLGIQSKRVADGYEVLKVLDNAPTAKGSMKLLVGDVVIAIEGTPIGPKDTLESSLANRTGRETLVTVKRGGKDLDLLLMPISFEAEAGLFYDVWRRETAQKVSDLSGGRLGYIHIRGMNAESLATFERDLFAAADGKDGLLIDVRNNGGGSTTDLLLGSIMYTRHAYTIPRGFKGTWEQGGYPQDRLYIQRYNLPINLLCNEKSFSNAEIFSHAFKHLKRGTLIGQQTAGGVISTGGTSLLDGTTVRLPGRGWYTPDGTNMELNGAMPDIVVFQTPDAETRQDDEQLKVAIDDLLKRLPEKK